MSKNEIRLNFNVKKPILACGADIKGAFAVAIGRKVYLFGGFGDLGDADNLSKYRSSIEREWRKLKPALIVCDMHPGYFSTRCAEFLFDRAKGIGRLYRVQHHEAHIASSIVDQEICGDAIGVAFDGTGFGPDGAIWGGEFFTGGLKGLKRAAHMEYVPMPGGEIAIKEPWRMAGAYIYSAFGVRSKGISIEYMRRISPDKWKALTGMIDKKINSPLTSSVGRLFDAVGGMMMPTFSKVAEAEVPIALEKLASRDWADRYQFEISGDRGQTDVKVGKMISGIVKDLSKGVDRSIVSGKFHNTVAEIVAAVCVKIGKRSRLSKVLLSGGVFQNRLLSDRASYLLGQRGFDVYRHLRVDTNDNGIPVGQIAIANSRVLCA